MSRRAVGKNKKLGKVRACLCSAVLTNSHPHSVYSLSFAETRQTPVKHAHEQKKKGGSRKATDPFAKKEWYDVKAPSSFAVRDIGKTVVTKTIGQSAFLLLLNCLFCVLCLFWLHTEIARDSLLGRVFEMSYGDLKSNAEDEAFRKFRFKYVCVVLCSIVVCCRWLFV